eukprot:682076-Rhodomonas_salina.1
MDSCSSQQAAVQQPAGMAAQLSADTFLATSNGRFEKLPADVNPFWKEEMKQLFFRQQEVGKKPTPILAIWGADVATEEQQETLLKVLVEFLGQVCPCNLMISGRRSAAVADQAEKLLRRALE